VSLIVSPLLIFAQAGFAANFGEKAFSSAVGVSEAESHVPLPLH
jgi:hypothetical protein